MRNRLLALIVAITALMGAGLAISLAQTPQTPTQRLDAVRAEVDQLEQTLKRPTLSDNELRDLRSRLDPLSAAAASVVEELTPRFNAAKTRLDQLGPKPAANAPPESAEIAQERDDQQKALNELDGSIKRARLLAVDVDDVGNRITGRRRDLFTHALFARSFSILSPSLWLNAARETPREIRAASNLANDWGSIIRSRLSGGTLAAFLATVAGIALLYVFASRAASRVIAQDHRVEDVSRLRKAISALWITIVTAVVPVAVARALVEAISFFDLSSNRIDSFVNAVAASVGLIAMTLGIVRGLIAPSRPDMRLLDIGDRVAARISWVAMMVACVVAATRVIEAFDDLISASVPISVVVRGVSSLAVAGVMISGLYGLIQNADHESDDCLGPRLTPQRDWYGVIRMAAWAAIVAIVGATVVGYVAFASFLVDQIVWVSFVGVMFYIMQIIAEDGVEAAFRPQAPVGRALVTSLGLRREALEQLAVLCTGAATVVIVVVAAMLCLAPWGIESGDMFGAMRAAFFGFQVGDVTISLSNITIAIVFFGVVIGVTRVVQRWLEVKFLPRTQLDIGLRSSIRTSVGYLGFVAAAAFALGHLGLSFERIAIVAGALSVGIGFGLQSIVNNFVSGLIRLWERAIRVGDWVVLGDEQGYVRRINVRSTEIETFDRATMIVPNSNLVSGVVKNWVRTDRVGRIRVALSLAPHVDPEKVREVLIACAKHNDGVLKFPAPSVLFTAITEAALKFELVCFVGDVETSGRVKSDLHFALFRDLTEHGMSIRDETVITAVTKK